MTRPKSSRDKWNELVLLGAAADVDDIADMSEEEVDAALAKAGFDVAEENRKGKAEHDAAVRARAPKPKPARIKSRVSAWFAAPAAALVASGTAMLIGETVATVGNGQPDAAADGPADAGPDGGESGTPR